MPVPTAQILVALLAHIGGPLMQASSPDPNNDHHHLVPEMRITVGDDLARVAVGQQLRYQVTVSNPGSTETPVTIKLTLSPDAVTSLQARDAAIVANAVAWKHLLKPGETRSYSLDGVVASRVDTPDLAVTACVHLTPEAPAVTCATDLNAIAEPARDTSGPYTWLAAGLLALLAVIGAIWLQKKIQPPMLTPANADPGQPGGAPSV